MNIITQCQTCQIDFSARSSEVNRGNAKYCTLTCFYKRKRPKKQPNSKCHMCSKLFYRSPSSLNTKTGYVFCSRVCKEEAQTIKAGNLFKIPHYGTENKNYRKIAFDTFLNQCNRCGYNKYPEVLVVHHVDRNRSNNNSKNLEILCPTCHMEEHYESKDGLWA